MRAGSNRGLAWNRKKEYDKAIRDYDEAIRLDPKYLYAPILGHFAARQAKDDVARRLVERIAAALDGAKP